MSPMPDQRCQDCGSANLMLPDRRNCGCCDPDTGETMDSFADRPNLVPVGELVRSSAVRLPSQRPKEVRCSFCGERRLVKGAPPLRGRPPFACRKCSADKRLMRMGPHERFRPVTGAPYEPPGADGCDSGVVHGPVASSR